MASSITIEKVDAAYGAVRVIEDVSMTVNAGETVALLGTNGNGKSTLMKCIMGIVKPTAGRIVAEIDGVKHDLVGRTTQQIVDLGIALVPEGRRLFPSLSVEENLLIGGQSKRPGPWTLDRIYGLFPVLAERRHLPATALSGGQQQMAAIGRALMSNPRLLLCDEISLGLAPIIVRDIYAQLPAIVGEGLSLIIVEQDIVQALRAASHVYCLQEGRIALHGKAAELTRESISAAYFGV